MDNKDFRERMWRSAKWGTFGFHEDACLGLCKFCICELCVDFWISLFLNFQIFWMFGVFLVYVVNYGIFVVLSFWIFDVLRKKRKQKCEEGEV